MNLHIIYRGPVNTKRSMRIRSFPTRMQTLCEEVAQVSQQNLDLDRSAKIQSQSLNHSKCVFGKQTV